MADRKFVCVSTNYFRGHRYREGKTYLFDANDKIPKHFQPLEIVKDKPVNVTDPASIIKELDKMGVKYDHGWKLGRLKKAYLDALDPKKIVQNTPDQKKEDQTKNPFVTDDIKALTCQVVGCQKLCKSLAGLSSHMKNKHPEYVPPEGD